MKGIPEDILASYHGKDEDWPAKMVKEEAPTDGLDRPKTFGFGFPPESTYGAIYKEWVCSAQGSKNLPSSLPGVTALDSSTALKGLADSDFNTRTRGSASFVKSHMHASGPNTGIAIEPPPVISSKHHASQGDTKDGYLVGDHEAMYEEEGRMSRGKHQVNDETSQIFGYRELHGAAVDRRISESKLPGHETRTGARTGLKADKD